MKNIYTVLIGLCLFFLSITNSLTAQVIPGIKAHIQQEDEWCWVGSSSCILDYYGHDSTAQCTIADYTRTVATWYNFGTTPCCTNPSGPCNYWNYDNGYAGAIDDILMHFKSLKTKYVGSKLTASAVTTQVNSGLPFVIRWGWSGGGGHFIVGYGINGSNVYLMNPWFGEGLLIATYNWTASGNGMDTQATSGSTHTWTETLEVTTPSTTGINDARSSSNISFYPNPASDLITIQGLAQNKKIKVEISDVLGRISLVKEITMNHEGSAILQMDNIPKGIYTIKAISSDAAVVLVQKLMINK